MIGENTNIGRRKSQPFEHIEPIEPFEQLQKPLKPHKHQKPHKHLVRVVYVQPLRKISLIKIFLRKMLRTHV